MAAAEYFQQGPLPSQHMQPPRPQQSNPPSLPYPISDEPPPYSSIANTIRPHSQPPPNQRAGQPVLNGYGPPMNGQYAPEKGSNLQNMYNPSDFGSQQQNFTQGLYPNPPSQGNSGPSQQQGLYPPQAMQGVYGKNDGRRPSSNPGYYNGPQQQQQPPPFQRRASSRSRSRERSHSQDRDRDRDRDRSRHRRHHHHHHNGQSGRPTNGSRKKSSGVATFLGAGGGAIIGDAIFPGLGTIGGALLGGVGGHEYGKQRRSYSGTYSKGSSRPRSYSNGEDDYYDDRRGRKY